VNDRGAAKEALRLLSAALTLVSAGDAADMAKAKPFALEVRGVGRTDGELGGLGLSGHRVCVCVWQTWLKE
jgi:hypothetical protein